MIVTARIAKMTCDLCGFILETRDESVVRHAKRIGWLVRRSGATRHACPSCRPKIVDGRTKAGRQAKLDAKIADRPLMRQMLGKENK